MLNSTRIAALAGIAGLSAALFTVDLAGLRAESPLEFFTNQHRQQQQRRYEREPVHIERGERHPGMRERGFFDGFVEFFEEPPRQRRVQSASMQRVVCKRQCDGAQLVLGILPSRSKQKEAEAMCVAAGGAAQTELVVEKFVPGAGFAPPPPVRTASAAPLMEGRASLDMSLDLQKPKPAASRCPAGARNAFMTVPILHDSTLRHGDVVAAKGGFQVFVGKGKPPHKQSDFVALDSRKKVSSDLRKLKIADR